VLVCVRTVYHLAFVSKVPFALATISDGRAFEAGARDIVRYFPLGSEPLQLSGLYSYLLSIPLLLGPWLALALIFQLALAMIALFAFHRIAMRAFGRRTGALATITLLAYPALAFFENKFAAVELNVLCSVALLWSFVRMQRMGSERAALPVGVTAGVAALAAPTAWLALPFTALATARANPQARGPALGWLALGFVLALSPMALRNQLVVGTPEILPRHAISLPLYIGNNESAEGSYNDGDVIDRAAPGGRAAVERHLNMGAMPTAARDAAIDRTLTHRTVSFVHAHPWDTLQLVGAKAFLMLGNAEPTEHFDWAGERALLGDGLDRGIPFGLLAALGVLGIAGLFRGAFSFGPRDQSALPGPPLAWFLLGQVAAPLAVMLLGFASSGQRVPTAIPLAFAAGPASMALLDWIRSVTAGAPRPNTGMRGAEVAVAAVIFVQAFVPRDVNTAPSAWHYFHLGDIDERIGSMPNATLEYDQAIQRDPREPVFLLRQARLLKLLLAIEPADDVLRHLELLEDVPPYIRREAAVERAQLDGLKRYAATHEKAEEDSHSD
jgi:hypothetical protein